MTCHRTAEYREPPDYYTPVPKWQPMMLVNHPAALYRPYATLDMDGPIDGAGQVFGGKEKRCSECGSVKRGRKCRHCGHQ